MADYTVTGDAISNGIILNNFQDSMTVLNGGTANNTTVNGGSLIISDGGTARDTVVKTDGEMTVFSGGAASNTTVSSSGELIIEEGGRANGVTITSGGSFLIYSGGTATDIVWTPCEGGHLDVTEADITLTFVSQYSGVYYGQSGHLLETSATMDSKTLGDGDEMYVMSGGKASETVISGGQLWVWSSGTADKTVVGRFVTDGGQDEEEEQEEEEEEGNEDIKGFFEVYAGGVASNTSVGLGGSFYIWSGGTAKGVTVGLGDEYDAGDEFNECWCLVSRGGIASDVTLRDGGWIDVMGGTVYNATVEGGYLEIGGTACNTVVNVGGSLIVYGGGKLTGRTTIQDGADISADEGATIDFDISGIAPDPEGAPLLNGLSLVSGWDGAVYTLTVNGSQADGKYVLAGGAADFDKAITVVNTSGESLGSITAGTPETISGAEYTLSISGGVMSLQITTGAPPEPTEIISGLVLKNETRTAGEGQAYVDTTINEKGWLQVSQGGTANSTTVNSGGCLYISSGGSVNSTTVNSGGKFEIKEGGTANSTTLNDGITLRLGGSRTANNTTINSGGSLEIMGGTANSTTVNLGGMFKAGKGTALAIRENGGYVEIKDGATVSFLENTFSGLALTGKATVHSGTTANDTTINEHGSLYVSQGGTANSTTVNNEGRLYVSQGGTANSTTVSTGGELHVFSGGTANSTTVNSGGKFEIKEGGTANSTTVNSGGRFEIKEGGTANSTTVSSGASFHISSGVTASETTVNKYGSLSVFSSGTALAIRENGGYVEIKDGATVSFLPNTFSDLTLTRGATVHSGTTANATILNENGYLNIFSGGTANSTTASKGGVLLVSEGGTANSTTVILWGRMEVSSGGTANETTVSTGQMFISNGGYASKATLFGNADRVEGDLRVWDGGIAEDVTVERYGDYVVSSGGTALRTTIKAGGVLYVSEGGTATDIDWTPCIGHVKVYSGAIVTFVSQYYGVYYGSDGQLLSHAATIMDGKEVGTNGVMYVMSNGTANSTTVKAGGCMFILNGGIANATAVSGGSLCVSEGGTASIVFNPFNANFITSNAGAVITYLEREAGIYYGNTKTGTIVSSANMMTGLAIESGFSAIVYQEGKLDNATVNSNGKLYVSSGGTANSTTVNSWGNIEVAGGGTANDTVVSGYQAILYISDGGEANTTSLFSNGQLVVRSGGTARSTTVESGCQLSVYSGGVASNTTVKADGGVRIDIGGKLTGRMSFDNGVYFEAGGILDFDLTQTTVEAEALVNDLSRVNGAPVYTITVDGTESSGTYRLADGVSVFNSVVSVMATSGEQLGSLMAGQKLETEYADYALKVSNGSLILTVTASGIVPPAGDTTPPSDPAGLDAVVSGQKVALVWDVSSDDTGVKEYIVKYTRDGQVFTARTGGTSYVLNNAGYGTYSWSVQAVDFAGNKSAVTAGGTFTVSDFQPYIVEYSTDNFEHVLRLKVNSDALDSFRLPAGTYQTRTRAANSADWTAGGNIVSSVDNAPMLVKSDADGNDDAFFANASGVWESKYGAKHNGSLGGWAGTHETVLLSGKNKLADIFEGSTDANILLMTDDDNGDVLFVDDIYTALPGTLTEQQARIAMIDEIRAGAGDDIVDMTSQRFEYIGEGLTIRGGDGDDVIWANKGDNFLFGDAGNDRIVGASGNDVIAGGIGNDSMHGGGGNDVFAFCDNWGADTVEQLADGTVTLWFASGDEPKWNPGTLTYTDGDNSVTVSGVSADKVELKFGENGKDAARFATLSGLGTFDAFTSRRIFEESDKGILAGR